MEKIYTVKSLLKFLDEQGIVHTPSTPYRQCQNGISERMIQTLLKRMRTNLKQSGLSINFWCWSIQHITTNRLFNKQVQVIPLCLFMNTDPESLTIDHLVPFGCIAVSFIPEEKRKNNLFLTVPNTFEYFAMIVG